MFSIIKKFLVCNFCFSNSLYNKTNIFLGLIEYEPNSLLGALYLVDTIYQFMFDPISKDSC